MTLTTHAIVGAAAAAVVPAHPFAAFAAGFVSHFVADTIPHKDYDDLFKSLRKDEKNKLNTDFELNKDFVRDFAIIAGDGLLGLVVSLAIFTSLFPVSPFLILLGAFGGQVPDALQFVYYKTHSKILEPLQRFHIWIQQKSPIAVPLWVGLGLQCVCILLVLGGVWLAY